ncbi:ribosomal protein S18 acetylase RimI-like enzyme [Allocatelliglobosispora scoriae]|uniref:Ribosomal protein S18 acetylase RimI-like enzyme n=1 Tax=Allocatelliglobosispora scoriae TaxID=643052 RepID=A0A841BRK0_9ACTN|nr:GNAT family N-acetyltransferase [Allocatelliglobosispora scoriae]MBB5871677.1 ribosomal protein S18 acetylase RimI-like enzyme [Allocatelliglobosispora scoriae]
MVRRKVTGGTAERPLFTDILGDLIEINEIFLTLRSEGGEVRVPIDEVHRAKTVPARTTRRAAEIAALELAAARAWPAPVSERLGDWWLRSAEGFTGRANSALPVGDPGLPLPAALDAVAEFYRGLGRTPLIDVPQPLAQPVADAALKAGWLPDCTVLVQSTALDALIAATPDGAACTLHDGPSDDELALIAGSRGPLPPAALHVLTAVDRLTFARYAEEGRLLARGRGTVTDGWLGLYGIETVPSARRRGLAQSVIGRLARWGAQQGAERAFLQVESSNETAIALYARLGFATHHRYTRLALAA